MRTAILIPEATPQAQSQSLGVLLRASSASQPNTGHEQIGEAEAQQECRG
jgi:hypothetical protein